MGIFFNLIMKFATLAALVATVSAIRMNGDGPWNPAKTAATKSEHYAATNAVVAEQVRFQTAHNTKHAADMDQWDADCEAQKNHVRKARNTQVTGGNEYPAFKVYGGEAKK